MNRQARGGVSTVAGHRARGLRAYHTHRQGGHLAGALVAASTIIAVSAVSAQQVLFVDARATGANNGSSWTDAYLDLQEALDAAQSGDEIWVGAGTYRPSRRTDPADPQTVTFELISGVGVYGGFAGWETDRSQRDPGINNTVLSGDLNGDDDPTAEVTSNCCTATFGPGCDDPTCQAIVSERCSACDCDQRWSERCALRAQGLCCELCGPTRCENSYHVVTARETGATTVLDGVTVADGEANGPAHRGGAGLDLDNASPTVTNCTFERNVSSSEGGGIRCVGGSPTVTDCTFLRNEAPQGGGMWNTSGEPTVTNCTFIENQGEGLSYQGNQPITRCRFIRNSLGSGLELFDGVPDVIDCLFIENSTPTAGGGMFNPGGGGTLPRVINCGFYGNSAGYTGGGLWSGFHGIILYNCVFSGNRVDSGLAPDSSGLGGAVSLDGAALVLNSTFVGNFAEDGGGGIRVTSSTTLINCVLWGNSSNGGMTEASQIHFLNFPPDVRYSAIQGLTASLGGVENVDLDPLFVDADGPDDLPGTVDDNFRLSAASPLINLGHPDTPMVPDPPALPVLDRDGHPRILCGRVDMGAYEFGIGDFDCNGVVELSDFGAWPGCMTGPDNPPFAKGCEAFDFNADDDVDLPDFAALQNLLGGRGGRR